MCGINANTIMNAAHGNLTVAYILLGALMAIQIGGLVFLIVVAIKTYRELK